MYKVIQGNCLEELSKLPHATCLFADPPDNLGLAYANYRDKLKREEYKKFLLNCFNIFLTKADIVWISFYYKWTGIMGQIVEENLPDDWDFKPCVQTFTFGQCQQTDMGNNYRPLWRFKKKSAILYPDAIRVPSWRQENGDKRADPRGRVPGDVFEFPRVTGNSNQRRQFIPTQLHEGLVERCILLSTKENDLVYDIFSGSGTTLRVCKKLNRQCIAIELSQTYCDKIKQENDIK